MAITFTPTGTNLQISSDSEFNTLLNNDDSGEYRTSQTFARDSLPYGVDLYARVRHIAAETGAGKWSQVVKFQVATPKYIIGVCMDNSGTTKGTFYWIDAVGNRLTSFDWQNHPTYAGIACVTTDTDRGDPVALLVHLLVVRSAGGFHLQQRRDSIHMLALNEPLKKIAMVSTW